MIDCASGETIFFPNAPRRNPISGIMELADENQVAFLTL